MLLGMNFKETHSNSEFEIGKIEKTLEIAKAFLNVLDIEIISNKTGLSIDEVKNLGKLGK